MKIGDVVIDETVDKRDRNKVIEIDCFDLSGDFTLKVLREIILVKDGKRINTGGTNGEEEYLVVKKLSEIMNDQVTISGLTLTGAQIAAFVEGLSDLYRKQ